MLSQQSIVTLIEKLSIPDQRPSAITELAERYIEFGELFRSVIEQNSDALDQFLVLTSAINPPQSDALAYVHHDIIDPENPVHVLKLIRHLKQLKVNQGNNKLRLDIALEASDDFFIRLINVTEYKQRLFQTLPYVVRSSPTLEDSLSTIEFLGDIARNDIIAVQALAQCLRVRNAEIQSFAWQRLIDICTLEDRSSFPNTILKELIEGFDTEYYRDDFRLTVLKVVDEPTDLEPTAEEQRLRVNLFSRALRRIDNQELFLMGLRGLSRFPSQEVLDSITTLLVQLSNLPEARYVSEKCFLLEAYGEIGQQIKSYGNREIVQQFARNSVNAVRKAAKHSLVRIYLRIRSSRQRKEKEIDDEEQHEREIGSDIKSKVVDRLERDTNARTSAVLNSKKTLENLMRFNVRIYISHHPDDRKFCSDLKTHLKTLEKPHNAHILCSSDLGRNTVRSGNLDTYLDASDCFIVFITPEYLASDSLIEEELTHILGCIFSSQKSMLPIIITPCNYETSVLGPYEPVNSGHPVKSYYRRGKSDEFWVNITIQVQERIKQIQST